MGDIFEEMAREYVCLLMARGQYAGDDVSSRWSTDGNDEIDIVGTRNVSHVTVAGSVKWREKPLDRHIANKLDAGIRAMGGPADTPRLLIGRGGIDATLAAEPNVRASHPLNCTHGNVHFLI